MVIYSFFVVYTISGSFLRQDRIYVWPQTRVAEDGFELLRLLPPLPECMDHTLCTLPRPVNAVLELSPRLPACWETFYRLSYIPADLSVYF